MKAATIIFGLILALALAQALLTLAGVALVFALVCALILRPRQTLLLAGEFGLFCLVLTYPWTAVVAAGVLVVGLAVLRWQASRSYPQPKRRGLLPPG